MVATEPMVRNVPRGRCAITKAPMGHIPRGSQVIVIKAIDGFKDPMVEIEFCGRVA